MSFSRLRFLGSLPYRSHKPPPFSSIRFRRHGSSAAVDTVTDADTPNTPLQYHHHPWPEWVSFVDRLKTKGYFDVENITYDALVKVACLNFARDRYDIIRSLPTEDIRTVVGHGCPHLFYKVVNSAKKLRAHVRLNEVNVCNGCNLRGSCGKADVTLKEDEAGACTVDMMRVLLYYALDPLVVTGGEKPPGREIVDASTRKLFSELIKLSETTIDPLVPKPASESPPQKAKTIKGGDWICPKCNFMNFARNIQCRQCKEDGPKNVGVVDVEIKKGDWTCSKCNFMNFSRNKRCLKCKADGPDRVDVNEVEKKKGDWNCPQCGFMNFSSNKKCLRCPESRPKRQLNPGEWECPSCDFLNYRRNKDCLKCNGERPKRAATEYEDQTWIRPRVADTFTGTH
ncbi:hypothetical protein Dsin_008155 [Dipteronia sinensis]|uniref:RanBP2-type domain-containing protein n=1 Tax=Dipteronia sinensis TaxID=43782 RepID=A0AAE0EH64_9ROSI|nr:hypothetical protein Dsin_008155 [Dipteronia sinensis]